MKTFDDVAMHNMFSGILAGIYPDACIEQTVEFLKMHFRADILITEQTTLQALLKVIKLLISLGTGIFSTGMCIDRYLVSVFLSLRQLYCMKVKWSILLIMFIQ